MPTVYKVYKGSRFGIWNWDGGIEIVGQVYERQETLEVVWSNILAVLSSRQVLCISKSNKNNSYVLMVFVYCYHDPTGKVFLPNFGWGQRMDRLSSGNSYFFFQQKSIKTTEFVLHHFDK